MWLDGGSSVLLCVTADYGQRSAAMERRAAQRLARRFDLSWRGVELPWLGAAAAEAGSALVHGGPAVPTRSAEAPGDEQSAASVWVPARNVVLVAVAAAFAEAMGADAVLAGFNREEAATFPDNSAEFVEAMSGALAWGTRRRVAVTSPTQDLTKVGIAAEARRCGLTRDDFWSCYGAGPEPCGQCESCVRSAAAWARVLRSPRA